MTNRCQLLPIVPPPNRYLKPRVRRGCKMLNCRYTGFSGPKTRPAGLPSRRLSQFIVLINESKIRISTKAPFNPSLVSLEMAPMTATEVQPNTPTGLRTDRCQRSRPAPGQRDHVVGFQHLVGIPAVLAGMRLTDHLSLGNLCVKRDAGRSDLGFHLINQGK